MTHTPKEISAAETLLLFTTPPHNTGLTIAPIAKNNQPKNSGKPDSKFDYQQQQLRTNSILDGDQFHCWDDHGTNSPPTQIGDYFAFYFHGKYLEFHKVIDVLTIDDRLCYWNSDSHHSRRRLNLSPRLFTIPWDTWVSPCIGGLRSCRRTYRVNLNESGGNVERQSRKNILREHVNDAFVRVPNIYLPTNT